MTDRYPIAWSARRWRRDAERLGAVASALERFANPWLALAIRLAALRGLGTPLAHEMMLGSAGPGAVSPPVLMIRAGLLVALALGVGARPAALVLLAGLWLGSAQPIDPRLLWSVLLAWIVVTGAGAISVDRLLWRGTGSIAVPGAGALRAGLDTLGRSGGDIGLLVLRVGIAVTLGTRALAPAAAAVPIRAVVAALGSVTPVVPAAVLVVGVPLLLAGALTRPVALVLALPVLFAGLVPERIMLPWALVLAILVIRGAGRYGVDPWLARCWAGAPGPASAVPHVVVVGGGFGGVAAVRGLKRAACRVTLVDQRNHYLFQPLLYQVATAGLSPGDIAIPVRSLFRQQENARIRLGHAVGVDTAGKRLLLATGAIPFDTLVIATGAQHGYLGHGEWERFAPGLKTVEDATAIRHRLLRAFEEAESATDAAARQASLTFVIVGGGPTGVELAGAVADLARHGLAGEFRDIDPASARVVLVHAGPRLLPSFPERLSREAERALTALGVEIRLESRVGAVGANGVTVADALLPARTVIWAAGVMASPAAAWLGVAADRSGRVVVGPDLTAPGHPDIFVLGDTAACDGWAGRPVPGLAPAAKQQGAYAARVLRARLDGRPPPPPFRYRHLGSLATVGRQSAVADFGLIQLRGALAWWFWGAAHVAFLVGGRNRVAVLVQWFWAYVTFRPSARLITGIDPLDEVR